MKQGEYIWLSADDHLGNERIFSVRLGILFFLTAFSDLFGTPIQGALLGPDNTFWYRGILFSAVSHSCPHSHAVNLQCLPVDCDGSRIDVIDTYQDSCRTQARDTVYLRMSTVCADVIDVQ